MKKFIYYTFLCFAILISAESKHAGGPAAVSAGMKSAFYRMQRQQRSVLSSFGFQLDNIHSTGIFRRRNDEQVSDSSFANLSVIENIVQSANGKGTFRNHGLLISGGGAKKKVSSRKKISLLPPVSAYNRPLLFWENMICGAISRSVAQTVMHPANTMKTILQSRSQAGANRMTILQLAQPRNLKLLTRGAGAQFILSVPHGAVNFAVLEFVRRQMSSLVAKVTGNEDHEIGPGVDFCSSAISTICCSIVSTPQMMITDNIMAGTYQNLGDATVGLAKSNGLKGFYTGWWPGLAGKIPSYGLTWVFFQQLKRIQLKVMQREPKDIENSIMGCMASATTVCIMIPMDTVKTRLVTQANYPDLIPYKGISDCAKRVLTEEGMIAFYRGLAPRLISVVPMIGIQFGVYEFMKKVILANNANLTDDYKQKQAEYDDHNAKIRNLSGIAMEVAADDDQPFPAPNYGERKRK